MYREFKVGDVEILRSFLSRQRWIPPGEDLEAAHRVVLR